MEDNIFSSFVDRIEELTKKPEKYLSLQEDQAEVLTQLTKDLYNFTKQKEDPTKKTADVLEELVTTSLDEEQIWQQVELQNNSICNNLVTEIAHLLAIKDKLGFPVKEKRKKKSHLNEKKQIKKEETVKNESSTKCETKIKQQKAKSSVVDDKFFKLHEMENYLKKVEQGEESEETDDSEIDYFEDDVPDKNEDCEKQFYYNEFFDQPDESFDGSSETSSEMEFNKKNKVKKVKIMLNNDENADEYDEEMVEENANEYDEGMVEENANEFEKDFDNFEKNHNHFRNFNELENDDIEEDDDNVKNFNNKTKNNIIKQPSTFEARQERLKSRIQNLEEEALREKPWQLKGEVMANNRPQNSLLEEYVEFDIATRPAPVLTEKSTMNLEDVIIQRIKDKAWDDVVRKIKPVESDIEYKKKLVLDQEKSKLSLAQIYEQEYLNQLGSKNEEMTEKSEIEAPEHQEIRIMMNKLFSKLDALSNFHFTPKQVKPEVKIISNLPAINMEEVAPVFASDAALLAPEEIKPKSKGTMIGKSERTATDKRRERRQKKLKQKLRSKQMEMKTKLKLEKSDSKNLQSKKISNNLLQKIIKSNNVTQLEESENGKYVTSSNAFFSRLQSEVNGVNKKRETDFKKSKVDKKMNVKRPTT